MTTRTFTAEELAKYNGQDGAPAYVVGKFTGDPEV